MKCVLFLQGDEGPIGPPGSSGPTVRTCRLTYFIYTNTHIETNNIILQRVKMKKSLRYSVRRQLKAL